MTNTFDTIVVGAGMAGGWAAKEFAEQGFKTLIIQLLTCCLGSLNIVGN